MATVSLTGFLLGFLLSSVALRHSIADAHQAVETRAVASMDGIHEEHQEDTRTESAAESKMLKGRKMGGESVHKRKDMKAVKGKNKPGASTSAGNCDHQGKGELHVQCELSGRGVPSGINLVDFIPFSSDYHAAKTHPPKNN